jgi:selenocysteine lyase/cysteine desulfurase
MNALEKYFEPFRKNTIGIDAFIDGPAGRKPLIYADWIASGRLYGPIEDRLRTDFYPLVGNTHSEASAVGTAMTMAYHRAHEIIKNHVNAGPDDVILTTGSGMTGVINKLQRILGMRIPERARGLCGRSGARGRCDVPDEYRPVVFVTHMEHHSNHISWLETIAEVVVLEPDERLLVDPDRLRRALKPFAGKAVKIGAFSAASNVTGIRPAYHALARVMHEHGGLALVDFAASAPYDDIDMHPADPLESLDAIFFSPHKFLGGPGSTGVLVFNRNLYANQAPDQPGGGTVTWTNRWGEYHFVDDIESREDGGTPAFLQSCRAALAVRLKENMGVAKMHAREDELIARAFRRLARVPGLHILAPDQPARIGVVSFYVENIHYNLIVKLLSDRYGIQVRGGCSCAGTYGHFLLNVDRETSNRITSLIDSGDLTEKPGWVRLSLHPTMSDAELDLIVDALEEIVRDIGALARGYDYEKTAGEFFLKDRPRHRPVDYDGWFSV